MRRKKILLVDDSSTALMIEQVLLSRLSCEILTARDGVEGFEKAANEHPDLILLDCVMPRLDGLETCRLLRAHEKTRRTPIILVTTRGEARQVESGYRHGCSEYVTKPIDGVELVAKVRSLLGGA
jgi:DNA-binding response OmpR family regulator